MPALSSEAESCMLLGRIANQTNAKVQEQVHHTAPASCSIRVARLRGCSVPLGRLPGHIFWILRAALFVAGVEHRHLGKAAVAEVVVASTTSGG